MSELERAIEHDQQHGKWYAYGRAVLGGTDFIHPVEIAGNGNVVCRTGSSQKPVAPDEYLRVHREFSPFRKVGIWDFVPWDDEAAGEIRAAHQNPGSSGRKIVRLQERIDRLEAAIRSINDNLEDSEGISVLHFYNENANEPAPEIRTIREVIGDR